MFGGSEADDVAVAAFGALAVCCQTDIRPCYWKERERKRAIDRTMWVR